MTCFHPLEAWQKNGIGKAIFNPPPVGERLLYRKLSLPCGQCVGCRLERSRQWATRCVHEASLYENNCFITLTYDDEHINQRSTLVKKDFQDFMKRLRKKIEPNRVRFFHCGEYGDINGRPHYHAILFNYDFPDRVLYRTGGSGFPVYVSNILCDLWPFGLSFVGDVSFESCAYVARYCLKKVTGDSADEHYSRVDPETGEVYKILPEYTTMSRRPGIGEQWLQKYHSEVSANNGRVRARGHWSAMPRYYRDHFGDIDPQEGLRLASLKREQAEEYYNGEDVTPERLSVREELQKIRLKNLPRPLDI